MHQHLFNNIFLNTTLSETDEALYTKYFEPIVCKRNTILEMAKFTTHTCLLISGIKSKVAAPNIINDSTTKENLDNFIKSFENLINK